MCHGIFPFLALLFCQNIKSRYYARFAIIHGKLVEGEGTCCTGALKAYKNSLDLHRQVAAEQRTQESGDSQPAQAVIPARLLNNAAVVFLACGKQREALDLVREATQVGTMHPLERCLSTLCEHLYGKASSLLGLVY